MTPTCKVAGCRRKPHARGLCQRHYDAERKAAAAAAPVEKRGKAPEPAPRPAKEKDKQKPAKAANTPPAPAEKPGAVDDKACCVSGCTNPHHARGYCKSHYGQLRRRGRIEETPAAGASAPAAAPSGPTLNKERRLLEIMKRHEVIKKEIANIHKELESEVDDV